ncbi:MAG TPA: methionyl-tRNA formyltransferase [Solirubrobacterales bacterium]|nr:methionyl-tRNA formyltransferase [Solirubrobacterales bacterium]
MNVVFLGTSSFAATVLRGLAQTSRRPLLAVTPPDSRRGRGRQVQAPPVATAARELGIELLQSGDVNSAEARGRIRSAGPEAAVLCAFGQLIREPLLSELPMLNVHPSLLPRWRGAAPIERAIMAGDAQTGVSIMRLSAGLDSGPLALREETPIGPDEDFAALCARLAGLGGELAARALELQAQGRLVFEEQDEERATYAEKIEARERRLDPALPAKQLARTVRALTPHIGAYLELAGGQRLGVRRARPVEVGVRAGEVKAEWGVLLLGCGRGTLRLEVVQPQGGKPMSADAFLRGHQLPKL